MSSLLFIISSFMWLTACSSQAPQSETLSSESQDEIQNEVQEAAQALASQGTAEVPESEKKEPFAVSEPIVSNVPDEASLTPSFVSENRESSLKEMNENIENARFFIDDSIFFPEDQSKDFSDVTFHTNIECSEIKDQTTFKKEHTLPYRANIPLVQLLPEEIWLKGNRWWMDETDRNPVCKFSFTAKNNNGDLHHFALPQLVFESFKEQNRLGLVSKEVFLSSGKNQPEDSPIVSVSDFGDYVVKKGGLSLDQLQLKCDGGLEMNSFIKEKDFFDLAEYKDSLQNLEFKNQQSQTCRFIGLKEKEVLAVSSLFPLVKSPPFDGVDIEVVKADAPHIKALEEALLSAFDMEKYLNSPRTSRPVVYLNIKNKNDYPVYLFAPERIFKVDYDLIFYGKDNIKVRFPIDPNDFESPFNGKVAADAPYFLNRKEGLSLRLGLQSSEEGFEEENLILNIEPESSIRLPVVAHSRDPVCSFDVSKQTYDIEKNLLDTEKKRKGETIGYAGSIITGKRPLFYQVLNGKNPALAQKTNLGLTNWSQKLDESPVLEAMGFSHDYRGIVKAKSVPTISMERLSPFFLSSEKMESNFNIDPDHMKEDDGAALPILPANCHDHQYQTLSPQPKPSWSLVRTRGWIYPYPMSISLQDIADLYVTQERARLIAQKEKEERERAARANANRWRDEYMYCSSDPLRGCIMR